jgi:hypothetical protein
MGLFFSQKEQSHFGKTVHKISAYAMPAAPA